MIVILNLLFKVLLLIVLIPYKNNLLSINTNHNTEICLAKVFLVIIAIILTHYFHYNFI